MVVGRRHAHSPGMKPRFAQQPGAVPAAANASNDPANSARRPGAHCLATMLRLAKRAELSVWSVFVSVLWPAVFALIATIASMVAWAALTPDAAFASNLLVSLLQVLFVLVMATVLLTADADSRR